MRKIRIIGEKKVEELVQVLASNYDQVFFISKKGYEELKQLANPCLEETNTMNFINNYDGYSIEIIMKFKPFCNMYYVIELVVGNNYEIYKKPDYNCGRAEIVIGAE